MEPFVLASGNVDKATEVAELLAVEVGREVRAVPLEASGEIIGFVVAEPSAAAALEAIRLPDEAPSVEETGATLEENARIKAAGVGRALLMPTVADDTGLEVDALGGAPGVHAARFAGEHATYADNVAKLLAELAGVPTERRTARFATVALAWWPDEHEISVRGEVAGTIVHEPRGEGGFGYDPVFAPVEGGGRTFAEMDAQEKHAISHRGRAFRALAVELATQ